MPRGTVIFLLSFFLFLFGFLVPFSMASASFAEKPSVSAESGSIRIEQAVDGFVDAISSFATRSAIARMSAIVVGHAEMAITM